MIAIRHNSGLRYSKKAPFNPSTPYPEYPFQKHLSLEKNDAYDAIRWVLRDLGFDAQKQDSAEWNPLGDLVNKGGHVTIKPNWVWDPPDAFSRNRCLESTITHPSILRAIIDYAHIAVGPKGLISIMDSPLESTNWWRLHRWSGFD